MARINIKWANEDVKFAAQTNFDLKKWVNYLSKGAVKNVIRRSSIYLLKEVKKRFITERSPEGRMWKRLSPITLAARRGRKAILKKSRKLMTTIRSTFYANELRISSPLGYANVHQKGKTIRTTKKQDVWLWHNLFNRKGPIYPKGGRRIRIPPRPFFGVNKTNIKMIRKITKEEFKKSEKMGTHGL